MTTLEFFRRQFPGERPRFLAVLRAIPAGMYIGDRLFKTAPLGEIILDFFLDAVHHRGQLTTYLRPMGAKVPAIYGPSGDEK